MPRMQKERHIAYWLRMLAEGEARLGRAANRLLKAQGKDAANAYERERSLPSVIEILKKGESDWRKVLTAHYAITISHLSDYTRTILIGARPQKQNFATRIHAFIDKYGLINSTLINKTTIDRVKEIINAGQTAGDSEKDIGQAIEDGLGGAIAEGRARTIARTETHNAASYAMQETAEEITDQTSMSMTREWVAVEDERTRPDHAAADGQVVALDEPFEVGGELLDRPGDPSGSPEQIINCRCALVYSITDAFGNVTAEEGQGGDVGAGGFVGE